MKKIITITLISNFILSIVYFIITFYFAEFNCVGWKLGGYLSADRCNVPNLNGCYCKLWGSKFLYDISGLWLLISLVLIIGYGLYIAVNKNKKSKTK